MAGDVLGPNGEFSSLAMLYAALTVYCACAEVKAVRRAARHTRQADAA